MLVEKLKTAWGEIALLSAWIVSIAGSMIIPLPSWYSEDNGTLYFSKFGIFIAVILSGFLILLSLRNKSTKLWTILTIGFLILFITSYVTYFFFREANTLPYLEDDIVIGTEMLQNNPFNIFENDYGYKPEKKDKMLIILGQPDKVWTTHSIENNRVKLILLLFACYLFISSFMVAFCNLIILYKKKYPVET